MNGCLLPDYARSPLNRCNLPTQILGGLTFQQHPCALELSGVESLRRDLFQRLDGLATPEERAHQFVDHMAVHFRLVQLEEVGAMPGAKKRTRANYSSIVRGWSFDSNSLEAAVLKHWVESRFGLLTRYHHAPLTERSGEARDAFLRAVGAGLYATNAIEAQLDLLYTYCQYELLRQHPSETHLTLHRGINGLGEHEILGNLGVDSVGASRGHIAYYNMLLNNVSSFTSLPERAEEFGDYRLTARVPLAKVCFFSGLLPGLLQGEQEFVVLGGVYSVAVRR